MSRNLKFLIAGALVALTGALAGYAVSAGVPGALRPAGTTRYAVIGPTNPIGTSSQLWVDMPNTSQSITIPSGKHGDVFISFCGLGVVNPSGYTMAARAMVGASEALPGYTFLGEDAVLRERCAQFYKLNVSEGTKTVRMQWSVSNPGASVYMDKRSVFVTVNIH